MGGNSLAQSEWIEYLCMELHIFEFFLYISDHLFSPKLVVTGVLGTFGCRG